VALELIRRLAYREGFGDILAEGCARAADIIGRDSEYYALHIKGQDLYEPLRGSNAWALGTTTSTRGGGHTTGAPVCETAPNLDVNKAKEVFGVDTADQAQSYVGKAQMVKVMEAVHRTCNCLGICIWNTVARDLGMIGLPQLAELYSLATGWDTTPSDLENLTMKQLNLEKAFNLRYTNFERKDDMPTPRDLKEPIPSGQLAGFMLDESKWNKMLDEYYDLHGWDRQTSFPKRQTLENMGLKYVADDLEKIGKLR
jgi:aldehyde:ferredoxin oxidoreductase